MSFAKEVVGISSFSVHVFNLIDEAAKRKVNSVPFYIFFRIFCFERRIHEGSCKLL